MFVLWDREAMGWNTCLRDPLQQQRAALPRGGTLWGWDGFFFLETRVEAECLGTREHTGTTEMDTMGEEICPQLIKHLHGVRYLLLLNK